MKHRLHIIIATFLFLTLIAWCIPPAKKIRVWMIGDSTMCNYETDRAPLTGWGMPFASFFDSSVKIENRARGGRSTRTFIGENRWQAVTDSLQEGDYVLIQFGHNDEAKEEKYKDRYTPVPDYKINLTRFITEARAKKAIPVLITPVTRMNFDKEGHIKETHKEYSAAVWEVGKEQHVTVIDLDAQSRALLQKMGPVDSKLLFMQLDSAEHPNYPLGQKDNTHFNEYGARLIAQLVLNDIRRSEPSLGDRIIKPVKK